MGDSTRFPSVIAARSAGTLATGAGRATGSLRRRGQRRRPRPCASHRRQPLYDRRARIVAAALLERDDRQPSSSEIEKLVLAQQERGVGRPPEPLVADRERF